MFLDALKTLKNPQEGTSKQEGGSAFKQIPEVKSTLSPFISNSMDDIREDSEKVRGGKQENHKTPNRTEPERAPATRINDEPGASAEVKEVDEESNIGIGIVICSILYLRLYPQYIHSLLRSHTHTHAHKKICMSMKIHHGTCTCLHTNIRDHACNRSRFPTHNTHEYTTFPPSNSPIRSGHIPKFLEVAGQDRQPKCKSCRQ